MKRSTFFMKIPTILSRRLRKVHSLMKYDFFCGRSYRRLTDEAVNDVVVFTLLHIPKDNQLAVRTAKIIFHLMHQCAV